MESEPLLKVEHLSIQFGNDAPSVNDVSFELMPEEVLGIVGESGSGKSITCLSIMQLLSQKSKVKGSIWLEGKDLLCLPDREMNKVRGTKISMIFQEPMSSLNPSHKCGHQIQEAIHIHQKISKEDAKSKVIGLLEDVSLKDTGRIYNAYPHELSGGQLQRVMIAMALANYPQIIIADEPTTALDVTVQRNIMELLASIKKKYKSSIIFISHDLGVVKSISDRVIVMQRGQIVESGPVEELFNKPKHPYTKGLLACRPPLDIRLKRLPTVQDFLSHPDRNIEVFKRSLNYPLDEWKKTYLQISKKPPILEVENLNKWFPLTKNWLGKPKTVFKAVDNVSFALRKGEILGLVGESGSGKTTCGRSLLRLIEPTSGSINFDGKNVMELDKHSLRKLRRDFQIIFQDPYSSLNPRIKIGEAIMEPMVVHNIGSSKKEQKEKVIHLLEKVELSPDHFNRYPHQFSGGQRQRICIARTLSLNPKFIVCDESVSALDVSVQAQILNLLLELKAEFDLSYLFISHDISVIKFLCDNVMVMKDGKIVEKGSSEAIYNNPQNPYTQQLIEAIYK